MQLSWLRFSLVVREQVIPQQAVCYDITQRNQFEWWHFAYLQGMGNGVCDPESVYVHPTRGLGEILPGSLGEDCMCHIHADI